MRPFIHLPRFALCLLIPLVINHSAYAQDKVGEIAGTIGDVKAPESLAIVARYSGIFKSPPKVIPSAKLVDAPIIGNGNLGVAIGGPAALQRFYISKNDFWSSSLGRFLTVGGLQLSIPSFSGASYHQEQKLLEAEVDGDFVKQTSHVKAVSFVAAQQGLLITTLTATGPTTIPVAISLWAGPRSFPIYNELRNLTRGATIIGAPAGSGQNNVGHIDEVSIYDRALGAREIESLKRKKPNTDGLIGRVSFHANGDVKIRRLSSEPRQATVWPGTRMTPIVLKERFTLSAFVNGDERFGNLANVPIITAGNSKAPLRLWVGGGRVWLLVGDHGVSSLKSLPPHGWSHVAATYDGVALRVYLNGEDCSPPPASFGHQKDAMWFVRDAAPAGYINRRSVAVVTTISGAVTQFRDHAVTFALKPNETVTIITSVKSDLDATQFLAAAKNAASSVGPVEVTQISSRHREWWRQFWKQSSIDIPDKRIEKSWYGSLYIMASCSRKGQVAPGLFGSWISTDNPEWAGDYHFNYNYEAPYWGLYSSNHIDQTAAYDPPILDLIPEGKQNARRLLNMRGVYYQVGIGPWGMPSYSGLYFHDQKSNAAYAAINMVMRYYYTYDQEYTEKTAYPFIKQVGEFWEDYLKLENGRYVIYNDAIHEGERPDDFNPILTLGLLRTIFKGLVDISTQLNVDADRRSNWNDIYARLSDFPTQERNGKTVFRLTEKGVAWSDFNTLAVQHIWPAGAIGLGSDKNLLSISINTIEALHRWSDYNGFPTLYPAAARVGYNPKLLLQHFATDLSSHSYPNLFVFHGGGGIEDCGGVVATIDEMLLQSDQGVIRLFPSWPREMHARFAQLRAYGAFLVSAALRQGQVDNVTIYSEKGAMCAVYSPWPSAKEVTVLQRSKSGTRQFNLGLQDGIFRFQTEAGDTYQVSPR